MSRRGEQAIVLSAQHSTIKVLKKFGRHLPLQIAVSSILLALLFRVSLTLEQQFRVEPGEGGAADRHSGTYSGGRAAGPQAQVTSLCLAQRVHRKAESANRKDAWDAEPEQGHCAL